MLMRRLTHGISKYMKLNSQNLLRFQEMYKMFEFFEEFIIRNMCNTWLLLLACFLIHCVHATSWNPRYEKMYIVLASWIPKYREMYIVPMGNKLCLFDSHGPIRIMAAVITYTL